MLNEISKNKNIYIACGYTDLRKGIQGLVALVELSYKLDPQEENIFFFCGRRTDRIKILFWDKNGFLMMYKKLENGRFQWPRTSEEVEKLTEQQLRWLMEGLKINQPKLNKPVGKLRFN